MADEKLLKMPDIALGRLGKLTSSLDSLSKEEFHHAFFLIVQGLTRLKYRFLGRQCLDQQVAVSLDWMGQVDGCVAVVVLLQDLLQVSVVYACEEGSFLVFEFCRRASGHEGTYRWARNE